ncbi:hypothetical protein EOD39_7305 [Acipenser ruthenus]|uniref:Uncharacterized protein n=1 Tax=Acipenser ruthenus TaxID=7906 RepID=A0A444U7B6_ACIRT|nr:hypothetical protein EOD39_7305 [Acipenser ruthenus]
MARARRKKKTDILKNVAVIPDLRSREEILVSRACLRSAKASFESTADKPIQIHGLTVTEYCKVYSDVVEPMLNTSAGKRKRYSVELGRQIKQRLWSSLNCPSLEEVEQPEGLIQVKEVHRHAPLIDLDLSGEPMPIHPTHHTPMTGTDGIFILLLLFCLSIYYTALI